MKFALAIMEIPTASMTHFLSDRMNFIVIIHGSRGLSSEENKNILQNEFQYKHKFY